MNTIYLITGLITTWIIIGGIVGILLYLLYHCISAAVYATDWMIWYNKQHKLYPDSCNYKINRLFTWALMWYQMFMFNHKTNKMWFGKQQILYQPWYLRK